MSDRLTILVKNGTPAEERMRLVVDNLLNKYDLSGWIFTDTIEIDETAWPHSHPVLTLNTEFEQNEMMALAELLHEQLHWFEEENAERRDRGIDETLLYYPVVPSARPEGAGSEASTRLHLLVCHLEYQALKCVVGMQMATQTIMALGGHHYCWVYRTVVRDESKIAEIIRKCDLVPAALRSLENGDPNSGLRQDAVF